jgi:hypothetical protein
VDEAKAKGQAVKVDENNNVFIGDPGKSNVTSIKGKKPNKIELKRQEIFMQRLMRKIKDGKTPEEAQAEINREDYAAMPIDKKVMRLEKLIADVNRANVNDFNALRHNDGVIGDTIDLNNRAIQKMFLKLGITNEQQKEIIAEATKELEEARVEEAKRRMEAQAAQAKAKAEVAAKATAGNSDKAKVATLAAIQELTKDSTPKELPTTVPEGATIFGG